MYQCKKCNDRGIVLHQGVAYRCSCWSQKVLDLKIKRANLSVNFDNAKFSNFKLDYYPNTIPPDGEATYKERANKALLAAKGFVNEIKAKKFKKGLFFCGPVGSGKTFLASAIARELILNNHDVLFVVVPDFLDALRFTFDKNDEGFREKDLMDVVWNIPILILDDLGAHNYTQWTLNKIYSLLNYRLNHKLPTVITSNLSLNELENLLGDRTCSRIIALCNIFRLLVPKDIRYIQSLNNMIT
ncbi:ATP-binding protein [Desulfitibacter alkalitolerans]|uniref:ATP-binding protein n=1 Tax=Desulfitibacter alkalitolerans TaxID=264641 RepID=UPI000554CA1A|nr:ATP-binding protein [Desulfitibacter alkalitolerans]